jgi:hypothetical protein
MDPPKPDITLRFMKEGYEIKDIEIKCIKIDYKRKKPEKFDLGKIKLKRDNVP